MTIKDFARQIGSPGKLKRPDRPVQMADRDLRPAVCLVCARWATNEIRLAFCWYQDPAQIHACRIYDGPDLS